MERSKNHEQTKTKHDQKNKTENLLKRYYLDTYGFVQIVYGNNLEEIYKKILKDRE